LSDTTENTPKVSLLGYSGERAVLKGPYRHDPHPCVETKEVAVEMLKVEFLDALSDVNVSCLKVTCFSAEDQKSLFD